MSSHSSSFLSRALMNSLPGRLMRATYHTMKNGVWLPLYLSPWGNSSPLELPHIGKRDALLFPLPAPWDLVNMVLDAFSFSADDVYSSDIVSLAGDETMLQAGIGHHYIARLPLEMPSWNSDSVEGRWVSTLVSRYFPLLPSIPPSGSICTLRTRVLHRFVDEVAQIRYHGERGTSSMVESALDSSKGWFAPYLHATNRCPYIPRFPFFPRMTQPNIVMIDGPTLFHDGDYALAADLIETSPWVMDFFTTKKSVKPRSSQYRLAVLLVGIAPPVATLGWSSARRPEACLMDFTLPNMVPTLLLPAALHAPLIAYDAYTLADVLDPGSTLTEEKHAEYLLQYLRYVVDTREISGERMETYVKRAVETLVSCVRKCGNVMGSKEIASRAGVVILKLPASMPEGPRFFSLDA